MRFVFESMIAGCFLISSPAVAAITDKSNFFSVLCKVDNSLGFNQHGSDWVPARFAASTYIITKLEPKKHVMECAIFNFSNPINEIIYPVKQADIGFSNGCYSIKTLGEENSPIGQKCDEYWKRAGSKNLLQSVSCKTDAALSSYHFQVNGDIVLTKTYAPFIQTLEGDQKDSIVLEVGKCTEFQ